MTTVCTFHRSHFIWKSFHLEFLMKLLQKQSLLQATTEYFSYLDSFPMLTLIIQEIHKTWLGNLWSKFSLKISENESHDENTLN